MGKHIHIREACLLQGVCQHGEPSVIEGASRDVTFIVGAPSKADDSPLIPGELRSPDGRRGLEGISEDTPD